MATSQQTTLFHDYDGFVEKFKPKKTTDDCYTPQPVYDAVLGWVRQRFNLGDAPIARPFYPGGDFESYNYPDGCVVVDNPPFSIYAKILRWYHARGIRFFLFAPTLTMAGNDTGSAYYICNTQVTYENGAIVSTSFATNLDTVNRFVIDPGLIAALENAVKRLKVKKTVRNVKLPKNITSSALLAKIAAQGIPLVIAKNECSFIRKCGNYQIFGGGYLLSDEATRRADEARQVDIPMDWRTQELLRQLNAAPTANSKLKTPNCKLQTQNSQLPTPNCKLKTPNCQLPTANF